MITNSFRSQLLIHLHRMIDWKSQQIIIQFKCIYKKKIFRTKSQWPNADIFWIAKMFQTLLNSVRCPISTHQSSSFVFELNELKQLFNIVFNRCKSLKCSQNNCSATKNLNHSHSFKFPLGKCLSFGFDRFYSQKQQIFVTNFHTVLEAWK